jgi:hypothetical protein
MKTKKNILLILAFCMVPFSFGQGKKKIEGSGKIVKETRELSNFNAVKTATAIDVVLSQGENFSVIVEAEDNLIEHIKTEVEGNTLKVYTKANLKPKEAMKVHVTLIDVEELSASSAGDIIGKTSVRSEVLKLKTSSAGDITLDIDVEILKCSLSSSGDMLLSGSADELYADLSSAGDLNAFKLKARVADVTTSSAGDAKIYVTGSLKARASSGGDILYMGEPKDVDAESRSGGEIKRK